MFGNSGIRIIVVESHEDMRDLLDQSLRLLGATVLAVTTAREAILQIYRADIIVTDVALPDEDGVWLWERVNLQLRPIPIIGVTGYTAQQYPRIRQAKFARRLLKPVDLAELAKVIVDVLLQAAPTDAPPTE
jgi:two-component system, NtrC family, response regulator AtoC